MSRLSETVRHEIERGIILSLLIEAQMRPVPLFILLSMMEGQGWPLNDDDDRSALEKLDFHLTYLSDHGLVERKNPREGRLKLDIQTVRAVGKAVDLKDGRIAQIQGVRFPGYG